MSDPTEIVSIAELKAYLQVTSSSFDSILWSIKSAVEQFVKNYCNDTILHSTFTEYYDGNGGSILIVDRCPITAVTEINIDSDRLFLAATAVEASDIISSERNNQRGLIEIDGMFTAGVKNVKVVYSAGLTTIPADLKLAVMQICAREFLIQDKKMMGVTSQNSGDKTISLNLEELPRNTWLLLQPYVRPRV